MSLSDNDVTRMKTVFILLYTLSGSPDATFDAEAFTDLGQCELKRQELIFQGHKVGEKCISVEHIARASH